VKKIEDERRKNITPSETLFVVNFHEVTTKKEDLELLFEKYGKLVRIDLKRNYAFVQYSTVEEATKAKEATNGGRLDQSILSVEYVARQRSHNSTSANPSSSNNNNNRNRPHGNDRDRMDSRERRPNDRGQGGRNNFDRDGGNRYNNPPALYDDRGGRGGMTSTNSNRPIDSFRGRSEYRDRPLVNEFDSYRPTIYDNDRHTDRRASRESPPPVPLYNHHQRSGRSRSRSPISYRRRSPLRGGIPPDDDRMIHNDYRSRGRSPPRGGGSANMDHRRNLSPPDRFRGSYDRDHRGYRG
jgi:RNA recognition motif-containing protein